MARDALDRQIRAVAISKCHEILGVVFMMEVLRLKDGEIAGMRRK